MFKTCFHLMCSPFFAQKILLPVNVHNSKKIRQICLNSCVPVDTDFADFPPLYFGFWCKHLQISRSLVKVFYFLGLKARFRDKSEQV